MIRRLRSICRSIAAALRIARPVGYATLNGDIAALVASGQLIRTGDFLIKHGGGDLPDGQQAWFGRHVAKAYRAAQGVSAPRAWVQHRTTGRWIHVYLYAPDDPALYAGLHSYKGTRHLVAVVTAEAA
ncbi:hypothetical protein GCM10010331_49290 [Streptomyces xanthochromogenes]|uniref:hypothetical protein n=1 Tax=Streptomyces xanthochromogenes TaxID=67384 RepID=UPI001677FDAD|nr:hypothetical protein [Streptomyces xanthochromogenes]GHB55600.1 hypothetical protein GCM10010331_49290 [Streptomyces xanthochromogenes]